MYYNEEVPKIGRPREQPNINEIVKTILSYKNYRWLYEREWRMFADKGKVSYEEPRCVARVYIGSRVHKNHRNKIEGQLRLLRISCQIQKLDGYAMRFERAARAR
jgi:hypothetical protein